MASSQQVEDKRPSLVVFNMLEENTENGRQTRTRPSVFSAFSQLAGGSHRPSIFSHLSDLSFQSFSNYYLNYKNLVLFALLIFLVFIVYVFLILLFYLDIKINLFPLKPSN